MCIDPFKNPDNNASKWEKAAFIGAGAIAVVGGTTIVGALLAPVALSAVGFGVAGVTAGSIAASIQTPLTVAESWFAFFQSAGATGAAAAIGAKAGFGVGAVVAGSGLLGFSGKDLKKTL